MTRDNYDLWLDHDAKQTEWLEGRPVCSVCGEHIQDDEAYEVGDNLICISCMDGMLVSID